MRQLLEGVCTAAELDSIYKNPVGGIAKMLSLVEAKILKAANPIISGQEASSRGLEEARRIMAAASTVGLQEKKERRADE